MEGESHGRFRFTLRMLFVAVALVALFTYAAVDFLEGRRPIQWQTFSEQALMQARTDGRTAIVNFTADWDATILLPNQFALETPRVRRLIKSNRIVPLRADWTNGSEEITRELSALKQTSIPLVVIYPADHGTPIILDWESLQNDRSVISAITRLH